MSRSDTQSGSLKTSNISTPFTVILGLVDLPGRDSGRYFELRQFYTDVLDIQDEDLNSLEWDHVTSKLVSGLDEMRITDGIMRKVNYIIALMNQDVLPTLFGTLTHVMEWNYEVILFDPLLGETRDYATRLEDYSFHLGFKLINLESYILSYCTVIYSHSTPGFSLFVNLNRQVKYMELNI